MTTVNLPPEIIYKIFDFIPDKVFVVHSRWIKDKYYLKQRTKLSFGLPYQCPYTFEQVYLATEKDYWTNKDLFVYIVTYANDRVAKTLYSNMCWDILARSSPIDDSIVADLVLGRKCLLPLFVYSMLYKTSRLDLLRRVVSYYQLGIVYTLEVYLSQILDFVVDSMGPLPLENPMVSLPFLLYLRNRGLYLCEENYKDQFMVDDTLSYKYDPTTFGRQLTSPPFQHFIEDSAPTSASDEALYMVYQSSQLTTTEVRSRCCRLFM